MGGHHGPELPKIPDWKIYRVEDVPELMKVKKALAQHGLSDPWLRYWIYECNKNEVWKYTEYTQKGYSISKGLLFLLRRGMKYGIPAGIATAALEYMIFPIRNPYGDEHGHH